MIYSLGSISTGERALRSLERNRQNPILAVRIVRLIAKDSSFIDAFHQEIIEEISNLKGLFYDSPASLELIEKAIAGLDRQMVEKARHVVDEQVQARITESHELGPREQRGLGILRGLA